MSVDNRNTEHMSAAEYRKSVPLESEEQQTVFQWARMSEGKHPELKLLHHIPNGGLRNKPVAVRMTAEGVRRGVPDMCLPAARGPYHGLYIELKRVKGGKVSPEQKEWIQGLREQGYCATVCRGADDAIKTIGWYLSQPRRGGD